MQILISTNLEELWVIVGIFFTFAIFEYVAKHILKNGNVCIYVCIRHLNLACDLGWQTFRSFEEAMACVYVRDI